MEIAETGVTAMRNSKQRLVKTSNFRIISEKTAKEISKGAYERERNSEV